jgi:hypothetical protein
METSTGLPGPEVWLARTARPRVAESYSNFRRPTNPAEPGLKLLCTNSFMEHGPTCRPTPPALPWGPKVFYMGLARAAAMLTEMDLFSS